MNPFSNLTQKELAIFRRLNTPRKIQDFLEALPINFEKKGETCMSPRRVLQEKKGHCMEGAFLAAALLWYHGQPPLLMDLRSVYHDDDHVVALFKKYGRWGAISKTNHAVLRYREPVYRTPSELAMSYFHEYFLNNGKKTMRSYSKPFNLKKQGHQWLTEENELWEIADAVDDWPHIEILNRGLIAGLRPADPIEIEAGKLTAWGDILK